MICPPLKAAILCGVQVVPLLASGWTEISPNDTVLPPARYGHAWCYLPEQNALFLWSGHRMDNTGSWDDTWFFWLDSLVWRPANSDPRPARRRFLASCYVSQLGKVFVSLGADSGDKFYSDTWLFDPQTMSWESVITDTAPQARSAPGYAYDPVRNRVYDPGGRLAAELTPRGESFVWEPKLAPGVYFLRLEADMGCVTRKIVVN